MGKQRIIAAGVRRNGQNSIVAAWTAVTCQRDNHRYDFLMKQPVGAPQLIPASGTHMTF